MNNYLEGLRPDLFYTSKEVAEILRVSVRTVECWRATRTGPKFVPASHRMVRYRGVDVLNWLDTFATAGGDAEVTTKASPRRNSRPRRGERGRKVFPSFPAVRPVATGRSTP